MAHEIELTDEQLEMVAGAGTGNTSTQLVLVNGSTTGVNLFSPGASVSGGTTLTNVQAFQSAKDSHDTDIKTFLNLGSFNS